MVLGLYCGPVFGLHDDLKPTWGLGLSVCFYGLSGVAYSYAVGAVDKVNELSYAFFMSGGALAITHVATIALGCYDNCCRKSIQPFLFAEAVICNLVLFGVVSRIENLNLTGSLFLAGATTLDLGASFYCGLRACRSLAQISQTPNIDIETGTR